MLENGADGRLQDDDVVAVDEQFGEAVGVDSSVDDADDGAAGRGAAAEESTTAGKTRRQAPSRTGEWKDHSCVEKMRDEVTKGQWLGKSPGSTRMIRAVKVFDE